MKKESINYLLDIMLYLLIIASYFAVNANQMIQHEEAHKAINLQNGCKDSTITYSFLYLDGETKCHEAKPNPQRDYLHSINEIEGYNNQAIINSIFIATLLIIMTLRWNKTK